MDRPIRHLASTLIDVDLADFGKLVLRDLVLREVEVRSRKGQFYLMRVRPYRTIANVIDGVVITFQDITKLKRAEQSARLAVIVRDSNDAITLLDHDGRITAWNQGATRMYGYTEAEALEMNLQDLVPEPQRVDALALVKRVLRGETIESLETERLTKDGRTLAVWLTVTRIVDEHGKPEFIATTERDVTGRR